MTLNYLYTNYNASIIKISFQSHWMRHASAGSLMSVALDVIKNISIFTWDTTCIRYQFNLKVISIFGNAETMHGYPEKLWLWFLIPGFSFWYTHLYPIEVFGRKLAIFFVISN